ncbi:hypothetical protein K4L06_11315 [Lysobacter sp. BMK333-48F3]|uniref:hypothetical protein n=1 Tax=Lysobacter sp. BMK333-48F3 TaxID=2867962 RepID=UPI001C8B57F5|nr:hypothetical protein [Lysobacter sp. BMK333-48F3]MBX9401899.1 hypothetical protein [Lysobacter sp. BMK333-48F3]
MTLPGSEADDAVRAVHPVQLIAQGRRVWLAWQSCDAPEQALLKGCSGVLWAPTQSGLIELCRAVREPLRIEDETTFDFDAVLAGLIARAPLGGERVIDCWNLALDLRTSLEPGLQASLAIDEPGYWDSYDRFFSLTSAGEMIDFEPCEPGDADFDRAAEVLSSAMVLLLALTEGRAARGLS